MRRLSIITFILLVIGGLWSGYHHAQCALALSGSGYGWYYNMLEGCKFVKTDGKRFPLKTLREMGE